MKDVVIRAIIASFIGYTVGFFVGVQIQTIKTEPTVEVRHYLMKQDGYNYCPYCGEELKIETQDK